MKRIETYIGQQVMEWCFSAQAQNDMVALGKLSAAMLGTSAIANGLACTPTIPASMTVQIGPGEMYQLAQLEATVCGTLPADTAHQILKQGIRLDTFTTATFAPPGTSGQSINYLLEAQYQDNDISIDPTSGQSPVVLQFFDVDNPEVPWSGPNNSGSTSNTFRDGAIQYQIKAGVAANTGSQVTPTPDSGWVGLWVVTVPFGATSLTSGNISQYPSAPFLSASLLAQIQARALLNGNPANVFDVDTAVTATNAVPLAQAQAMLYSYAVATGTANAVVVALTPALAAYVDGAPLRCKIASTNTGAATLNVNGLGTRPIVGLAQSALQGGELFAGGYADFEYSASLSSFILKSCSGGALQVAPAVAAGQAVQLGQVENTTSPLPLATSASTSANQAVNQSQVIGVGQTLTNVTVSRAASTVYTNTTGKPMFVYVAALIAATNGSLSITVGAAPAGLSFQPAAGNGLSISTLVPAGSTYQVALTNASISFWYELR